MSKKTLSKKIASKVWNNKYASSIPNSHPIAYHGSSHPDLERLRGGSVMYKGGIGPGLYVTYFPEVAKFYGDYVYKVRLKFSESKVFVIDAYNVHWIEGAQGYSLLSGEQLYPFSFHIGSKHVLVAGALKDLVIETEVEREFARRFEDASWDNEFFMELWDLFEFREGIPKIPFFRDVPTDIDDYLPQINEFLLPVITGMYERHRGKEVDRSDPSDDYLDFEIEIMEELISDLQELLDTAWKEVEQRYDITIDLEDIGPLVASAGYKAVWFSNMRTNATVNTELLVFEDKDVELLGRTNG